MMTIISFLIKYYSSSLKENFLRELEKNFIVTYFIIWDIWVIAIGIFNDSSISQNIIFLLLFLPLILGGFHSFMYPNLLDKTLFLCPIEREERKHILIIGYWFRSICVFFCSLIIIACMLIAGLITYSWYIPIFLVSEGMLITMMFLENNIGVTWENIYVIWRRLAEIISIFSCMIFGMSIVEYSEKNVNKTGETICLLIILGIQIAFFLKVMISDWKKEMEMAADYKVDKQ